jgi:hypothetical protein
MGSGAKLHGVANGKKTSKNTNGPIPKRFRRGIGPLALTLDW